MAIPDKIELGRVARHGFGADVCDVVDWLAPTNWQVRHSTQRPALRTP